MRELTRLAEITLERAREILKQVTLLNAQGNPAEALRLAACVQTELERQAGEQPDNADLQLGIAEALLDVGRSLMGIGRYEQAHATFQRAADLLKKLLDAATR